MAKNWKTLRDKMSPERKARVASRVKHELAMMSLRELRERRGGTQTELAELLEVSQAHISKLEKREDILLSSLGAFVEALGGELEIVAHFPDGDVAIRPGDATDARRVAK